MLDRMSRMSAHTHAHINAFKCFADDKRNDRMRIDTKASFHIIKPRFTLTLLCSFPFTGLFKGWSIFFNAHYYFWWSISFFCRRPRSLLNFFFWYVLMNRSDTQKTMVFFSSLLIAIQFKLELYNGLIFFYQNFHSVVFLEAFLECIHYNCDCLQRNIGANIKFTLFSSFFHIVFLQIAIKKRERKKTDDHKTNETQC